MTNHRTTVKDQFIPMDLKELDWYCRAKHWLLISCKIIIVLGWFGLGGAHRALGLPVNFYRPMEPLTYKEIRSKNFYLYFDQSAPGEAASFIRSLEAAEAPLKKWLGVDVSRPKPVIISATTSNASFANFLTDAIEIQSLGQGGRDLAWHELTHSTMYHHLENILGPAGSILHLPWMPAWWIEGLAESMSVSIGGADQISLERYFSVTNSWPSYDKLHSLYGSGEFAHTGYGVAGGFVSYLLRTYDPERLPRLLADFGSFSNPWWWPMTVVPFTNFMPMDRVLLDWTGKTGENLYKEYQAAAARHWLHHTPSYQVEIIKGLSSRPQAFDLDGLYSRGERLFQLYRDEQSTYEEQFLPASSNTQKAIKIRTPQDDIAFVRHHSNALHAYVTSRINDDRETVSTIWLSTKMATLGKRYYRTKNHIIFVHSSDSRLLWIEQEGDRTKVCSKPTNAPQVAAQCHLIATQPHSLAYLGHTTDRVWLRRSSETPKGDRHQVLVVDVHTLASKQITLDQGGNPRSLLFTDKGLWVLMQSHFGHHVRLYDVKGQCLRDYQLPLSSPKIFMIQGEVHAALHTPQQGYRFLPLSHLKKPTPCYMLSPHRSPLTYSQMNPAASLAVATKFASLWQPTDPPENQKVHDEILSSETSDRFVPPHLSEGDFSPPQDAQWRGRSLFVFPWIGADGQGNSFGVRSVPLMDHMQNETVHLSALYGVQSKFPDITLMLESSRFKTHMTSSVFNKQTYNGVFDNNLLYYRETGGDVTFSRYFPVSGINWQYALSSAYFEPIIGPPEFSIEGRETKIQSSLDKTFLLGSFALQQSLAGEIVPEAINRIWIYNRLHSSTTLSKSFSLLSRNNVVSLGLSGSRTRGKKRKYLQEMYSPLKTFIPGDGGGLNGTNFTLLGDGYLTSARYGENQVRSKLSYTVPLIPDFETLIGIFYLQRLDFSAFINYGTAYSGTFDPDDLVLAHGFNLDLSTDIKGVKVNVGLGIGQVEHHDYEVYFKFGFDTLIDIES